MLGPKNQLFRKVSNMTVLERLKNIPHGELIVPKGSITIKSLYQFDDIDDLLAFVRGCEICNCTVKFANEGIEAGGYDGTSVYNKFMLSVYMMLKTNPKLISDYERFNSCVANGEMASDKVELN